MRTSLTQNVKQFFDEEVLIEQFGQDYIDYMKKTKRLIPFIY